MYEILVEKAWHDGKLYADACAETEGLADIANLISTPFVARDMLNIVDALGEDGMLRFWGRSYSSVLGQTFAAMFPDRIGRLFLDSVLRNDDYYSGQWATANRDTEASLLNFLHECVNAGSEVCTIANFSGPDTTAQDLHNELGVAFDELLQNPTTRSTEQLKVPVAFWQSGSVTLYQDLKYAILTQLYQPIQFTALNLMLEAILKRDWTSQYLGAPSPPTGERWGNGAPWNFHGIGCGDSHFRASKPEDMYSLVQVQQAAGSWADAFSPQVWVCAHWAFEAAEKFNGPFVGINTSYPVLLAGGLHDPITPISGAFEASANLLGSRVLQHNGHGVSTEQA
jgi:pimeloyl-ACP methyl ester carboxylesterase